MNEHAKREIRFWTVVTVLVITAAFTSRYVTRSLDMPSVPDISGIPIPAAAWDGQYPCVFMDLKPAGGHPGIGMCSVPGEITPSTDSFQVDLRYGKFILRQTDLFVVDDLPIILTRTYNSREWIHPNHVHAFGRNANHSFDIAPVGTRNPYTFQFICLEDGDYLYFPRVSPGTSYEDAAYRHSESSGLYYGAVQQWNGTGWTLNRTDGVTYRFPDSNSATNTAQGAPFEITTPKGHLILKRNTSRDLEEIRADHQHFIRFQYDEQHRISAAETDAGDRRTYSYNSEGMLTDVWTSSGLDRHYRYDGNLMTTITNQDGVVVLRNEYEGDVLISQKIRDLDSIGYEYKSGPSYFGQASVVIKGRRPVTFNLSESVPPSSKQTPK